jgi:hypothetical protein
MLDASELPDHEADETLSDASQTHNFEADDGAVINLGDIGGDVITNPELNVDLGFHNAELYETDGPDELYEDKGPLPDGQGEGEPPEGQYEQPKDEDPYPGQGEGQPPDGQYEQPKDEDPYPGQGEGQTPDDAGSGFGYIERPVDLDLREGFVAFPDRGDEDDGYPRGTGATRPPDRSPNYDDIEDNDDVPGNQSGGGLLGFLNGLFGWGR